MNQILMITIVCQVKDDVKHEFSCKCPLIRIKIDT